MAVELAFHETSVSFASYVGRGLPFVLIDSRPQPEGGEPQTVAQAMKALDDVEEALNKDGRVNAYIASTLACLHSALRRELYSAMATAPRAAPRSHRCSTRRRRSVATGTSSSPRPAAARAARVRVA